MNIYNNISLSLFLSLSFFLCPCPCPCKSPCVHTCLCWLGYLYGMLSFKYVSLACVVLCCVVLCCVSFILYLHWLVSYHLLPPSLPPSLPSWTLRIFSHSYFHCFYSSFYFFYILHYFFIYFLLLLCFLVYVYFTLCLLFLFIFFCLIFLSFFYCLEEEIRQWLHLGYDVSRIYRVSFPYHNFKERLGNIELIFRTFRTYHFFYIYFPLKCGLYYCYALCYVRLGKLDYDRFWLG